MDKPTIRTSQDLLSIPNYLESIDPKMQPLRRIVTSYYLNSEYPCGLKSCHQPHREGFLVELEDGNFSNVGWKCGELFGEKFAIERTRYAEQELRPKAIARIREVIQKLPGIRHDLEQLAADADRLSRYKQGMRRQFPRLYPDIDRRAHNGNNRVTEQIERTQREIEDLLAMNSGASREHFRYREEFRGVLTGLHVLTVNIREEVINNFTGRVDALLATDLPSLSTDKLLEWEGWALRFDESLKRAKDIVASGKMFFAPECFRLLTNIATVPSEKAALSKLTASSLLRDGTDPDQAQTVSANPAGLSKKQRDIQKRVAAILRSR